MIYKCLGIYLIIINVITFFIYGLDKYKAKNDRWRIPEKTLIGAAVIGGSIGAWAGMRVFHHKTRHPKFYIGVPVIFVLQIVAGVLYYLYVIK